MAERCQGVSGRLFGHAFEAVYSTYEKTTPGHDDLGWFVSVSVPKGEPLPQDEHKRTYHGHVCSRCGAVTNVPEAHD